MTYLQEILTILTQTPVSIDYLMEYMNKPSNKLIYMIEAIKKGIKQDKIIQLKLQHVTNKYYGHLYSKN